ncbi:MAG: hypothetical protein KDB23_01230 [Planctomycetales bacterium]|nr:hypothetical protein [Planctomycetales bacterium]
MNSVRVPNRAKRTNTYRVFGGGFEQLEGRQLLAFAGDANLDGVFDSGDLVQVFQAGKYHIDADATWAQGDWDNNQRFDSGDLVAAFQTGRYGKPAEPQSQPWVMSRQAIYDTNSFANRIAARVLVPQGWSLSSNIDYNPIPSLARYADFQTESADRMYGAATATSDALYAWINSPLPVPEGELYYGNVLWRVRDGLQHTNEIILPHLRAEHADYQVTSVRRVPEFITAMTRADDVLREYMDFAGITRQYDAIEIRGTYTVGGRSITDVTYATYQYTTLGNTVNWGLYGLERTWAPTDQFNAVLPTLRMIARSTQLDAGWYISVENFRAQIHGITINAQSQWNSYSTAQQALSESRDAVFEDFVQYIRGTSVEQNPFNGQFETVPSDQTAWFAADGSIVLTEDPSFDPNGLAGFNGVWRRAN